MLKFKGIDHINMNVIDLSKTISFYQNLFGFEIKESGEYFSENYSKMIKYAIIGKSNKGLLALYEGPDKINTGTINHLGFALEEISKQTVDWLLENNVKIDYLEDLGGIIDYPNSKSIYIYDPNGYEIELTNNFGGGL